MKKNFIYKGVKRPLVRVPNFGNIYMEDGDEFMVYGKCIFKKGLFEYGKDHRKMCYLSNIFCLEYGLIHEDGDEGYLKHFEDILNGNKITPLEYANKCIESIANKLPKRDLYVAGYNFSNSYRPVYLYKYDEESDTYNGSNIENKKAIDLAWYMYYNLLKLLPEGVTSVSAKEYEELEELY